MTQLVTLRPADFTGRAAAVWRNITPPKDARTGDVFIATPIEGDALTGDGIFDGDIAIVRLSFSSEEIWPGRLISISTPDGLQISHYYQIGDKVRLSSSNPDYGSVTYFGSQVKIQGVVVRIERDY
jgi:SOS-response transcriptional repressor LexA